MYSAVVWVSVSYLEGGLASRIEFVACNESQICTFRDFIFVCVCNTAYKLKAVFLFPLVFGHSFVVTACTLRITGLSSLPLAYALV